MLVSSSPNDYRTLPTSASVQMRSRTLARCEPAFPSRDYVRQENYARRKVQELQGWLCPKTIPYQDIEPVRQSPRLTKSIVTERRASVTSDKIASAASASDSASTRPKSSSVVQDDHSIRQQNEAILRRLKGVEQQYIRKSGDILRRVQLGHGAKDVVEQLSRSESGRVQNVDLDRSISIVGDEKEQEALYDRLLEDYDEDEDDGDQSSVSGIRDDIMSPRTMVKTDTTEPYEPQKSHLNGFTTHPVKLCHSAPPLNRKNAKQALRRPFTPLYSNLSGRLRAQNRMPFREPLYRQLCCILWLLRAIWRPLEQRKKLSGCWNIDQWQERSKTPTRSNTTSPETKRISQKNPSSGNAMTLGPISAVLEDPETSSPIEEQTMNLLPRSSIDTQTMVSAQSDGDESFSFPISSLGIERDLSESVSSKSNHEDPSHGINLNSSQQTANISLSEATPIMSPADSTQAFLPPKSRPLAPKSAKGELNEMRRKQHHPRVLLKKWIKEHTITVEDPKEPLPLSEKEIRLLRVGDKADLSRMFSLQNVTSSHREQAKARQTQHIEQKLGVNLRRRLVTSAGGDQSKKHAEILASRRREFEEFTEEEMTFLNNRLQRVDNNRLFYYQTKLNDMQKIMPTCILSNQLLKKLRYDKDKQKQNAFYLRYQSWYIDLIEMVKPEYSGDYAITCLLDEMKEYAEPQYTPTGITFKKTLRDLGEHEVCHPDIMAAIEFTRIHIVKMTTDEFDRFFSKQFPEAAKVVMLEENNKVKDSEETTSNL